MADDLNQKLRAELDEMKAEIRRLQRANPLESASVTAGRVRFIGGQLRIDAGGNMLINGTLAVNGTSTVTGSFTVSGPWNLSGTGTISGNVTITGNVTATGTLTQNGPWNMNGAGKIAGNVDITGILSLLAGGSIKAGNIEITPSVSGGSIQFGSSRRIDAGSGFLGIYDGSRFVVFNSSGVAINGGGGPTLTVGPGGVQGIPTIAASSAPSGSYPGAVIDTGSGLRRVIP